MVKPEAVCAASASIEREAMCSNVGTARARSTALVALFLWTWDAATAHRKRPHRYPALKTERAKKKKKLPKSASQSAAIED